MSQTVTMLEINGCIEQIIYRNEKNGYTVLELSIQEETVTAVGIMPWTSIGEGVKLIGTWKTHPTFGKQFDVSSCERTMPQNAQAILKYLSSGAIKGIGPTTATRLVETFGDKTLEIIEKSPGRLSSVKGITESKAQKIAEEFKNIFGIKELMVYVSKYGIIPEEAIRIWKKWGQQAIENLKDNPYSLCEYPVNINFEKADLIASSMQKPPNSISRIKAGIIHIILHNMNNGHTCLPKDKLIEAASNFLEVGLESAEDALKALKDDCSLISDIIDEREFLFIPKIHRAEVYCAGRLIMMLKYPPQQITGIKNEISSIETEHKIKYAELQKQAIEDALSKGMLILTGGPGTGKTTTLNAIIKTLKIRGEKVFLAAPTGRAAQRMSEVTGSEAKTIHRLLEVDWDPEDNQIFKRNEKNLLECDALVIDELSMVDSMIFESVLRALPLGCRLILVGDSDQLPSVGAGNILGDLINSGKLPVIQLKEIFRQSMQSLIVTNAHKIVSGEMPELSTRDNDFFFIKTNSSNKIISTIVSLYKDRLPKTYGYSPLFDIQVISPSRKGELGTINLNKHLQANINPPDKRKKEITLNSTIFRENDKVMQIKNNYDIVWTKDDGTSGTGVFNGDVGILLEINRSASSLAVQFDDKVAVYDIDNLSDLDLAYAITVHKSQGSEFEAVIMPMFNGPIQLYYRNLLYTAVTRAKNMIVMVGTESTVKKMVDNNRKTKRYSGLCNFLTIEG